MGRTKVGADRYRKEKLTEANAAPESIHGSQYREMDDMSDSDVTVRGGARQMPGEYEEKVLAGEGLPKVDRAEFIEEWRGHPLVPTLGEDDERRPKYGRIDLMAQHRAREAWMEERQLAARGGGSEWTAVTEWEEEQVHGEFMKMQPGERRLWNARRGWD